MGVARIRKELASSVSTIDQVARVGRCMGLGTTADARVVVAVRTTLNSLGIKVRVTITWDAHKVGVAVSRVWEVASISAFENVIVGLA